MNASQTLRAMLATEGIFLDETPVIAPPGEHEGCVYPRGQRCRGADRCQFPSRCARVAAPPVDRAAIREVLLERGAPVRDLDWLVASAPSMEHALAFEPTPWMLRADDFTDYLDERPSAAKGRP